MKLGGLQKLTLLDFPGRLACTVFTAGCNLRCPFCHNASLVRRPVASLTEAEVLSFLQKRRGVLEGVCLSGGEPLLQADAEAFLAEVRAMGFAVKLDTNGCFPDRLERILAARLVDYVAMDVKNCMARYGETVGIDGFDTAPVRASIRLLLDGDTDYEFRTTVVREFHDEAGLLTLAREIAGAKRYFLQGFEDSGDLLSPGLSGYAPEELEALRAAVAALLPRTALRGV